jgi:hypothetical protein
MGFSELRSFIDNSLKSLDAAEASVVGPQTEDEFMTLWRILKRQIKNPYFPPLGAEPAPPTEFETFVPSTELRERLTWREELASQLREARTNPDATSRSIRKILQKLSYADQEIRPMERDERLAYERRRTEHYHQHRTALESYKQSVMQRAEEIRKCEQIRPQRQHFVERVAKEIKAAFEAGPRRNLKTVGWRLLPPGEFSFERYRRYFEGLQSRLPEFMFQPERLEKAWSLLPAVGYVGTGEFEGYHVYLFEWTEKALLECPQFGNAIYIIHVEWKSLSRLTKKELLARHSRRVTKIVHKGDWFERVKAELRRVSDEGN